MFAENRFSRAVLAAWLAVAAGVMLSTGGVQAQSPEEHASHHPGAAPAAGVMPATAVAPGMAGMGPPAGAGPPAGTGGMAGGMGEMMKNMGKPPPKELYPTLMALPELTPEKRTEVDHAAAERMQAGALLMGRALDTLNAGAQSGDYAAMHEATIRLREGIAQLESGIAARRAIAEGRAPRYVALAWFKQEMNLTSSVGDYASHAGLGLSPLHLFTMALLIAFALAMLLMYYFKMRRAAALFRRIGPDPGSPPPGSSPPLGGAPGPPTPPGGKSKPSEGGPLPSEKSKAEKPAPPTIDKSPGAPTDEKPAPPAPPDNSPVPPVPPPRKTAGPTPPPEPSSALAPASPPNGVTPLSSKWGGRLRVGSIVNETPFVRTFRLHSPGSGVLPFTFTPGQFLNVAFDIGGARMNRSYSISSSPNERAYVDLTVKREERGAVSRHLNDLIKVGDEIEAGGPVGKFTFTGTEAESVVLMGAGVGITPMMSVARYLSERSWPGDIFFVYGCRAPADLIFKDDIAALGLRNPKLHVAITMSQPTPDWKGPRGRITKEFLIQAVPDLASRRVQLCGPPTMMDAIKVLLTEIGVSPENLKTEAFGAVKPAPAAPGTSAKPTVAATGPLVTFSKNNKAAKIGVDRSGEQAALATGPSQTILELSEELGIGIEFSCRIGTCGVCKVKMTAGDVDMAIDDALDDDDKKNGLILACQAKPKTEVTVEA
jgi:ferredoxin-NADP reductase